MKRSVVCLLMSSALFALSSCGLQQATRHAAGQTADAKPDLTGCAVHGCYLNPGIFCAITVNYCPDKGTSCTCHGPNNTTAPGTYQ